MAELFSSYLSARFNQANLLCDIAELTDIARPIIVFEQLIGIGGEANERHLILFGELRYELAEKQWDVVFSVTQRGHLNLYHVESIEQVHTEAPLLYSTLEVDVGSSHYAHVGVLHLLAAHLDILSFFQYAQELRLRSERQLGHLIEEERALVGQLEIALAVGFGIGKRALDMAEELGVAGAFGQRATVDGKKLIMFARGEVMDDMGENVLTRTVFARNQHVEVGFGHLNGYLDISIQNSVVADNPVALLDDLCVHC